MCTHDQHVQREDLSVPLVLVLSRRLQHACLIFLLGYYQSITKEVSVMQRLASSQRHLRQTIKLRRQVLGRHRGL
jgi:hypothetical protein